MEKLFHVRTLAEFAAMSPRPRTVLTVLVGAHVVNDFGSTVLPAFLPAVAEEFDLDYADLGLLSFAFVLLTGLLQPAAGNYADRAGRRRFMLVVGFTVGAGGFLAMAMAPTFWFIVAVSLLCGLGQAMYHPQATALIVNAFPERRGRALGIHGWGGSIGHFAAPAAVVLMVAWVGWRWAMAAVALPMFLAALVVRFRLDETQPSPAVTLRGSLTRPLIIAALAFGVVGTVGRSFLVFFVKMLVDEGWSNTSAGVLLTVILVGGAISQPLGGWAYDRIGGVRVLQIAASATIVLVGLFAVSSGALSLVAVAGIAFFQFSLFPVALAQASQLASAERTGAATGVVFGVSGVMTALAQPAVGALAEAFDDIRLALVWQLPLAVLGLGLAFYMKASDTRSVEPFTVAPRDRENPAD